MSVLSNLIKVLSRSVTLEVLVGCLSTSGRAKLKEQLEAVSVVLAYVSAVGSDSTTLGDSLDKATTFVNTLLTALE